MKNRVFIFLSFALLLLTSLNSAANDFKGIIDRIDTEKLQHPYIIFDNAKKQAILKRIAEDERFKACISER